MYHHLLLKAILLYDGQKNENASGLGHVFPHVIARKLSHPESDVRR